MKDNNRNSEFLRITDLSSAKAILSEGEAQVTTVTGITNPVAAEKLIAQIPAATKSMSEIETQYFNSLHSGIESSEKCIDKCKELEHEIQKVCAEEIHNENTSFEEKQFFINKMEAAAERLERAQSEHRKMIVTTAGYAFAGLATGGLFIVCLFLGGSMMKVSSYRR